MMIEFLQMLTKRKAELSRKNGNEWQTLVAAVADGRETDPDATLAALDRLGKSTDDLAKAVELLSQRRGWARLVALGEKAEGDLPKITKAIEAEVAAFAELERKHEETVWPMTQAKAAAANAVIQASEARRHLADTATDPLRLQGVYDADERLADLRRERAEVERELSAKQGRFKELAAQADHELDGQVDRLRFDIEGLGEQLATFSERAAKLNSECEKARASLLVVEAI